MNEGTDSTNGTLTVGSTGEGISTVIPSGSGNEAEWKTRFEQLNATHQELVQQLDNIKKAQSGSDSKVTVLTTEVQRREQEIAALKEKLNSTEGDKEATATVLVDLREQVRLLTEENAQRKRLEAEARWVAEQTQLVTSKYPNLLPLLEKDENGNNALPQASSVEELDRKLARLQALAQKEANTKVEQTLSGARPPGPGAQLPSRGSASDLSKLPPDEIWRRMQEASSKNEWAEYNTLREAWYQARK